MAARGYPGAYEKGSRIAGLDAAEATGAVVFHAGTEDRGDAVVAIGGRVLGVTALGADLAEARRNAYDGVAAIDWPEGFCRSDIGARRTQSRGKALPTLPCNNASHTPHRLYPAGLRPAARAHSG